MKASQCQERHRGDRLDRGLSEREMMRLWKGLGCERRGRQAPESVLATPASGEGILSILEEGETLETHSGQGF